MNNSKHILDNWSKQISIYKRLSIDDAKKIYVMMSKSDGKKKELLREELINGTLYLIPNFISKSILPYLKNNSYDMDDIISVCNEKWINIIDSGKLMDVLFFYRLFNDDFYSCVSSNLVLQYDIHDFVGINNYLFVDILMWYINESSEDKCVGYERFLDYYNTCLERYQDKIYDVSPCKGVDYVYSIVVEIYNYLKNNGYKNKNISLRQIKCLRNLLLEGIVNVDDNLNDIVCDDCSKEYIKKELEEKIINIIFNDMGIKDKSLEILCYRYGLNDGVYKSCEETGKVFGMTKAGVYISIERIFNTIKDRQSKVRSLLKDYFND